MDYALVLCSSGMATAALASVFIETFMVIVVCLSRKYHINPDNVATPIAGCLGDLVCVDVLGNVNINKTPNHLQTTLSILSILSTVFLHFDEVGLKYVNIIICAFFILMSPMFLHFATKDESSLSALKTGWIPIIAAMAISRCLFIYLLFTHIQLRWFHSSSGCYNVLNNGRVSARC
jgi:solute carrier family 41